jgi:hypothetical protein
LFALSMSLAGCGASPTPTDTNKEGDKIKTNLAKLKPEDRKLAEEQKYCALQTDHQLGSMGTPLKVEIEGQPVFLCCKSCEKEALAHPDKTLKQVAELRARSEKPAESETRRESSK